VVTEVEGVVVEVGVVGHSTPPIAEVSKAVEDGVPPPQFAVLLQDAARHEVEGATIASEPTIALEATTALETATLASAKMMMI